MTPIEYHIGSPISIQAMYFHDDFNDRKIIKKLPREMLSFWFKIAHLKYNENYIYDICPDSEDNDVDIADIL